MNKHTLENQKLSIIRDAEKKFGKDMFSALEKLSKLSNEINTVHNSFEVNVSNQGAFYACEE